MSYSQSITVMGVGMVIALSSFLALIPDEDDSWIIAGMVVFLLGGVIALVGMIGGAMGAA